MRLNSSVTEGRGERLLGRIRGAGLFKEFCSDFRQLFFIVVNEETESSPSESLQIATRFLKEGAGRLDESLRFWMKLTKELRRFFVTTAGLCLPSFEFRSAVHLVLSF